LWALSGLVWGSVLIRTTLAADAGSEVHERGDDHGG
jgi:hypothetical protein